MMPQGLPNLGNTCFLNSVLQQLFLIEPISRMLTLPRMRYENIVGLDCLETIFHLRGNEQRIRRECQKLIAFLQKNLVGYRMGDQFDSLETLLFLLNYLQDNIHSFECNIQNLSNEFKAEYLIECDCVKGKTYLMSSILVQSDMGSCLACNKPIKRTFVTLPNYLILRGQQIYDFINKMENDSIFYRALSYNIYTGNGRSGHYYTLANYGNDFYILDDSSVTLSNMIEQEHSKIKFAIFKKKQYSSQKDINKRIQIKKKGQKLSLIGKIKNILKVCYSFYPIGLQLFLFYMPVVLAVIIPMIQNQRT